MQRANLVHFPSTQLTTQPIKVVQTDQKATEQKIFSVHINNYYSTSSQASIYNNISTTQEEESVMAKPIIATRNSIEKIIQHLSVDEKTEFLRELFDASFQYANNPSPAYQASLCKVIDTWAYSVLTESDSKFKAKLEKFDKIAKDASEKEVDWREWFGQR